MSSFQYYGPGGEDGGLKIHGEISIHPNRIEMLWELDGQNGRTTIPIRHVVSIDVNFKRFVNPDFSEITIDIGSVEGGPSFYVKPKDAKLIEAEVLNLIL